ncbi:MAG TPA: hypothetical protein VFU77_05305 [Steroidobacteraceae bacterium]|nr:hypothetical protein [Steroidobacteraceae bacterium]
MKPPQVPAPVSDIKVTPPEPRERPGPDPAPRLPRRTSVSRHGAISRELTKYSNYKSWAEKARGAFAADGDQPGPNGAAPSRRSVDR